MSINDMCDSGVIPVGMDWQCGSIWGQKCGKGKKIDQISPLNGACIQTSYLIDNDELSELLDIDSTLPKIEFDTLNEFCLRLHIELELLFNSFLETTQLETAFNRSDCKEVVQSCLDYVKGFPQHFKSLPDMNSGSIAYNDVLGQRYINQIALPWGTVAAILPQSAFLFLALTCLLNALAAGNRVILRAPTQSARSAALLCSAIERTQLLSNYVSVVLVSAKSFINALCESPNSFLIHYLGSSTYAPEMLSSCFQAGKQVLIDGEGNAWVWIDKDISLDYAADILTLGALRYNGQTCTSINGAVIHPHIYDQLKERLTIRWNEIVFGNPLEFDVQVGPLLDEAQAEQCLVRIEESDAVILGGGYRCKNLLTPTLAAEPRKDSELVSSGFFGAALWIMPGGVDDFTELWKKNRYPLCAGILTESNNVEQYLSKIPNLARLIINGDPSAEYMYEPWGGYPGSGTNTVSHWHHKYLRMMQLDYHI